LKDNNIF